MDPARIPYRKLPGRRRGFLFGSSVWLGPDHLLLVKSSRFREEYRRFYFRDIQAIVSAEAVRLHISTRSALIGLAWLSVLTAANASGREPIQWVAWIGAALLVFAWMYCSVWGGCRCRIYTAVSSEELTSVYRRWTARRFVAAVEPHLTQVQGSIEGNGAEALEDRQVGPLPEGRIGLSRPSPLPAAAMRAPETTAARTPLAILFVASLGLGGIAEFATLGARTNIARWVMLAFLLLQVSTAIAVVIHGYMGKLRRSLRNLAIVAAVSFGVWYYAVQMAAGMAIAYRSQAEKKQAVFPAAEPMALLEYPAARAAAGGIGLLTGLAGVLILLRGERPPEERVSFNV